MVPEDIYQEHLERDGEAEHVVPGDDPDNPLGHYALELTLPEYALHGTNVPWGVGMKVSHGCIRLYPEDIERLYNKMKVGTPGSSSISQSSSDGAATHSTSKYTTTSTASSRSVGLRAEGSRSTGTRQIRSTCRSLKKPSSRRPASRPTSCQDLRPAAPVSRGESLYLM